MGRSSSTSWFGRHAHDGGLGVDQLFLVHLGGHAHGGDAVALADAALQHEELAFFDGELDVLHVLVVLLEPLLDVEELLVELRHELFERGQMLALVVLGVLVDRRRRADAGHHVFALGVDQVFAVELVLAVAGVAGEGHAGGGVVAHVAEDHGLHVDRGAPLVGDLLDAAVLDGALAVPAHEHRADAAPELLHRASRGTACRVLP